MVAGLHAGNDSEIQAEGFGLMVGRNARFRLEQPLDTQTATGGRTRQWPNMPEFGGNLSPLSASEQELWEREINDASLKLLVTARQIPEQHRDKVSYKNRVVVLNRRNPLQEETCDIIGVKPHRRRGRLSMFEITLGKIL